MQYVRNMYIEGVQPDGCTHTIIKNYHLSKIKRCIYPPLRCSAGDLHIMYPTLPPNLFFEKIMVSRRNMMYERRKSLVRGQ